MEWCRQTITLAGQNSQGTPSRLLARALEGSSGDAGAIHVEAGAVTLTEGAQISSSTSGAGQGGTVTVVARDTLTADGHRVDDGRGWAGDPQWAVCQSEGGQ